jgi:hypothetical protein
MRRPARTLRSAWVSANGGAKAFELLDIIGCGAAIGNLRFSPLPLPKIG